jgi:translation initiation factor eIF-2B subunit epsilon
MVLRSVGEQPHRAAKARGITPVFVVDSTTGRCLQYEETHPLQSDHYLTLDPSLLSHGEFEIRSDLVDCGIDICTPEVLALWSESFDYELPRKNFLHGVLKDWELNGKMIYAEILDDGYAARASNLQMYDCISRDVLERWTLPFVPDSNLLHGQTYRRVKGGSYMEDHVSVERGSKVAQSAVGKGTEIQAGSSISRSVIGRRCKIGKNVRIEDSYIWDDAVIGDGTSVVHSVIACSAVVGAGCRIPEGSLISYNVQIDNHIQLPPRPIPRISLLADEGKTAKTDPSLVGPTGKGASYQLPTFDEDSDDEEEGQRDPSILQSSLIYSLEGLNLSTSSISTLASGAYDSEDNMSTASSLHAGEAGQTRSRLSSFTSDASSRGGFHNDAVHGLVDALRADDSEDFDSAKLEFMGLRLANNASDSAMRRAIAVAFCRRAAELLDPQHGGLEPTKAAEKALTAKRNAVRFIKEVGVGGDEVTQQAEFALALQRALLGEREHQQHLELARAGTLLAAMLQQLYSLDVLEEDGILAWWGDKRASESEEMAKVKEKCRVLVEWLENADEEEDEEDEDEDEDEDSD